jgi:hypothetical protein
MFFRLLVSVGLVGFGYLIGREAGRAQAIREHLGSSDSQRRIRGETFDSSDYTVLDDSQATATRDKAARAKKPGQRQ